MPRMRVWALGSPTHTAVVNCGVAPTNQALVLNAWVPVFPAAGRSPFRRPLRPVPLVSTPRMMSMALLATSGEMTCTGWAWCW